MGPVRRAARMAAECATIDEQKVRDFCREQLAANKVPTRVIVVDDLPRSMLGKVLRKQVRAAVANQL